MAAKKSTKAVAGFAYGLPNNAVEPEAPKSVKEEEPQTMFRIAINHG